MPNRIDQDSLLAELPPGSGYRRRRDRTVGRMLDLALGARQRALGVGREIDRTCDQLPRRRVLTLGVYSEEGTEPMMAAVEELRRSRHELGVLLGALDEPAAGLLTETAGSMQGGKFANLNLLAEAGDPALVADWVLLLDDDVKLPRRFLDRLVTVAERLRFDIVQPALSRASHGAWDVNRRRAAMARQTQFVEIGPATLISRQAWCDLTPFPEAGMGWGLCLCWAALARRNGWRLGVVDAVPVRNEFRPPGASYDRDQAKAAATELLASREHITRAEAERVLASHSGLP